MTTRDNELDELQKILLKEHQKMGYLKALNDVVDLCGDGNISREDIKNLILKLNGL